MSNQTLRTSHTKAILLGAAGAAVALLGTLWVVQGLGLVEVPPMLCIEACEPITGGSVRWTVIGAVAVLGGLAALRKAQLQASR